MTPSIWFYLVALDAFAITMVMWFVVNNFVVGLAANVAFVISILYIAKTRYDSGLGSRDAA